MRHSVYFIASLDLTRVKIGKARDLRVRVRDLQAGSPYPLLLVAEIEGYTNVERWFHSQHVACRAHGEWFAVDERLAKTILSIQSAGRSASYELCPAQLELDRASIPTSKQKEPRKIVENDVIEMRGRYEHGESIQSIHRRYPPFSLREIGRAIIGLSWKGVALSNRETPEDIKKLYKRFFLTKYLKRPVNTRKSKPA